MEAINIFLKKEVDYHLFDKKIFNIKYWEFIRPYISCEVNSTISGESAMFAKNPFSMTRYLISIKNIKKYFLKNKHNDILIISHPRRLKDHEFYKNNYIDYYIDYLKDKYSIITIEEPTWSSSSLSKKAHDFPIYTDNIYFTDIHELTFLIKKKIYRIFHIKKYNKIVKEYNEIKETINSWYGDKHKEIEFKKFFIDSIIRLDIDRKYIKKVLKKISPKIIMLHYIPTVFKEMLVHECNKQNIPTVEIQHGTITKIDPLVNKCYEVQNLENDTKYLFGFGKNQVNRHLISIKNEENIIDIGSPFFENILLKNKNNVNPKKYILIISQSTIGDSMAKFASELAEILDKKEYKIVFKYHPSEISKNYKCLKDKGIIEIKKEKSIYDIQKQSLLQIGSYSTSLYEGFALKVPTLIISSMFGSIETIDIFENINQGVYYIEKPSDVLDYLNKNDIIPLDRDIKKLWEFNTKKNIINIMKKLLR